MSLVLVNLQSNEQIHLDKENPLIIGRNNILGCFDKKVSRNHGKITCTENGEINLVALHTNPCFFMKNGVPPIYQLKKDEEKTLNKGDCLGFLPNSFWYRISDSNVEVKKEEINSESCSNSETANLGNIRERETNSNEVQNVKVSTTTSSDYARRIGSPEFEKTRKLPLSAYDTDEVQESSKCLNATGNDANIKNLKSSENDIPKFDFKNTSIKKEDNRDGEEPSTSEIHIDETLNNSNETKELTDTKEDKETKPHRAIKRRLCQYEHDCFRKNPQHKIEFCHPGDSDYVAYKDRPNCRYGVKCRRKDKSHRVEFRHVGAASYNSSPDLPPGEERPPRFGGSRCLDLSPQDREHLYHHGKGCYCLNLFEDSSCSSEDFGIFEDYFDEDYDSDLTSPLPLKRRRKQVKRNSHYDDEEEDELEVEDPFGNDASSDEYVPSDSNSEE